MCLLFALVYTWACLLYTRACLLYSRAAQNPRFLPIFSRDLLTLRLPSLPVLHFLWSSSLNRLLWSRWVYTSKLNSNIMIIAESLDFYVRQMLTWNSGRLKIFGTVPQSVALRRDLSWVKTEKWSDWPLVTNLVGHVYVWSRQGPRLTSKSKWVGETDQ